MHDFLRTITVALRSRFCVLLCLLATPALLTAQRTIRVPGDAATIQAGINLATEGDTVLVAPGTYYENLRFPYRNIIVTSSDGASKTTIDGRGFGPAADFSDLSTVATVLNGFTLLRGGQTGAQQNRSSTGAVRVGISGTASPTISNNIFLQSNCAAILVVSGSPRILNNTIRQTVAPADCITAFGTPILLYSRDYRGVPITEIAGNLIEENITAGGDTRFPESAGITVRGDGAVIHHNILRNNKTASAGGAIAIAEEVPIQIFNNLIYANYAERGGGGLYLYQGAGAGGRLIQTIASNTIADNSSGVTLDASYSTAGSQISIFSSQSGSSLLFLNNIVSGSSATSLVDCTAVQVHVQNSHRELSFDHTLFWNTGAGSVFGTGCVDRSSFNVNLVADPMFVDRASADYHLRSLSPGVDSGTNGEAVLPATFVQVLTPSIPPIALTSDIDGSARVQDASGLGYSVIDRGAYEQSGRISERGTLISISATDPIQACKVATVTTVLTSGLGTPTGSVTFFDNDLLLGSAQIGTGGQASITTPPITAAYHEFRAVYAGDGIRSAGTSTIYAPLYLSAGTCTPTATLKLISSDNPAPVGTPVTFTADVSVITGTPSGAIVFTDGAVILASVPLVGGRASFTSSSLSRGTHTINATYSGGGTYTGTSDSLSQKILGNTSITTLTASATNVGANTPVTLAAMTDIQGGGTPDLSRLQILDGSRPLAPVVTTSANGIAVTATLTPGTHTLTAVFSGDTVAEPSSSTPVTVTVEGASTTVGLSFNPSQGVAFQTLDALATVRSATQGIAPSGSVAFTGLGSTSTTVALSATGTASLGIDVGAGTYVLTATYIPSNGNTLGSTATATLVVNRAPVALSLIAPFPAPIPQSQSASFNATFDDGSGRHLATGTVVPTVDGAPGTPLALTADGKLTLSLSGLLPGTHRVMMEYAGDANFLPASSNAATLIVLERDFKIGADAGMTLRAGTYRSMPLALTSIGDFAGDVDLHCEDLPAHASCRFSKAPLHVNAGGNASTTVTLETSALPGYEGSASNRNPYALRNLVAAAMTPFAMLALFGLRRRHAGLRLLAMLVVVSSAVAALNGCSGQIPASTPAGTYTVHIVGSSGQMLHTHAFTVTVTSSEGR